MDYVVGSVAALISGNVTPNRPKFLRRALTPTKHQPSPNVTPKSELAEDRSIFLSPTMQKKKAIVKKSPKRIFQNPEVDLSNNGEDSQNSKNPKTDKAKKHLKEELEADVNLISTKSPKNFNSKVKESALLNNNINRDDITQNTLIKTQVQNECTPKKKKRNKKVKSGVTADSSEIVLEKDNSFMDSGDDIPNNSIISASYPKKVNNFKSNVDKDEPKDDAVTDNNFKEKNSTILSPKKRQKKHLKKGIMTENKFKEKEHINKSQPENNENENTSDDNTDSKSNQENTKNIKNKKRKRKNILKTNTKSGNTEVVDQSEEIKEDEGVKTSNKKIKSDIIVNPNAITDKDTDSEHDSDDEIESENEQNNKEVLDTGPPEESSDEEEKVPEKKTNAQKNKNVQVNTEAEVKRTLFVGNVPFSAKCKKEIKKIFGKYGQIETIRIRTIPVKDGSVTPKLAVIKKELHPDRTTVNVYVKFHDASSVKKALVENGKVLNNCHLRVTPSDCTGSEHDPKCSIFIGNLPFALEDEALQQKFAQCGDIVSVRIIRDKKTNAGKGFGYVNFKSKDAVELALVLPEEELTIKNRILRVKRCTQATQKRQQDHSGNVQNGYGRKNTQGNYGRETTQGNFGRGNSQGNFGRGNSQGNFGRGNSQGNFGRGNSQGNFGRGNGRGNFGRGNGQENFGRGNGQGNFGRGNGQGNFGRGNSQGNFGRGNGQENFGRGNGQGNFGRGNGQGNFGRGNGQGNFGRGNGQGNFGRGDGQGTYGRGNAHNRNQFGNRQIGGTSKNDGQVDGALRRVMNKRKNQDADGGPPNKIQRNSNQAGKKARKEFVGVTAEKKKKNTFNKGQKKKKALSEILTK